MFQLLLASITLFGNGGWSCTYSYDYPEHNVRETYVSNVQYSRDLSYVASSKIIYSHLNENEVFAQFSYLEEGMVVVSGRNFYLDGKIKNFVKDFDKVGHFADDYVSWAIEFMNRPMDPKEKTLTVIFNSDEKMTVKHEKSGTITECEALVSDA